MNANRSDKKGLRLDDSGNTKLQSDLTIRMCKGLSIREDNTGGCARFCFETQTSNNALIDKIHGCGRIDEGNNHGEETDKENR